jgi:hypothetical protein
MAAEGMKAARQGWRWILHRRRQPTPRSRPPLNPQRRKYCEVHCLKYAVPFCLPFQAPLMPPPPKPPHPLLSIAVRVSLSCTVCRILDQNTLGKIWALLRLSWRLHPRTRSKNLLLGRGSRKAANGMPRSLFQKMQGPARQQGQREGCRYLSSLILPAYLAVGQSDQRESEGFNSSTKYPYRMTIRTGHGLFGQLSSRGRGGRCRWRYRRSMDLFRHLNIVYPNYGEDTSARSQRACGQACGQVGDEADNVDQTAAPRQGVLSAVQVDNVN